MLVKVLIPCTADVVEENGTVTRRVNKGEIVEVQDKIAKQYPQTFQPYQHEVSDGEPTTVDIDNVTPLLAKIEQLTAELESLKAQQERTIAVEAYNIELQAKVSELTAELESLKAAKPATTGKK